MRTLVSSPSSDFIRIVCIIVWVFHVRYVVRPLGKNADRGVAASAARLANSQRAQTSMVTSHL